MADGYFAALQKVVVAALKQDAAVVALIAGRVCDVPPEDVVFPYVRIGDSEFATDDTDGTLGVVLDFAVVVHTSPPDYRPQNTNIQQVVYDALHRSEDRLDPEGYQLDSLEFLTSSTTRDGDQDRWEGRMAFQAKMQPDAN